MSSGSGGGGERRGSGAASAAIPLGTKKMVQSLKEIVSSTEQEIYAMLKECNMDPNEAVNRLISQDTFHEVKSKREKKKEAKETLDSRSQRGSSSSSRGGRGGAVGRNNSIQIASNDNGVTRGKPIQKKENGANAVPTSLSLGSDMAANSFSRRSTHMSTSDFTGDSVQSTGLADGNFLPSQPSSTCQHSWLGVRGHLSMADIVKMGRPQGKPSGAHVVATDANQSYSSHDMVMLNTSHDSAKHLQTAGAPPQINQESYSSQDIVLKVTEISHEPHTTFGQHISLGEWSLVDQSPAGSGQIVSEISGTSSIYRDPELSTLRADGDDLHPSLHSDDILVLEGNVNGENLTTDSTRSASISDRQIQVDSYGGESCLDDGSLNNMSSYQSPRHPYERHEVEDTNVELSSAAANLQQLSLHEEQGAKSAAASPTVIIPDHLQVTNADCSYLSFGSFGTGISASFTGALPSKSLQSNLEVPSVKDDTSSIDPSDARESEYYDNERLRATSNDNVGPTSGSQTGIFDMASTSQPEAIRDDSLDATHGLRHNIPTVSGHAFSTTTQPNAAAYAYAQSNSQTQNLAPFSDVMQPYNLSLPSNLLAPAAQPYREFNLPLLPLFSTQSMPTKHSNSIPSTSVPTISMSEAVKQGAFSIQQPTQQTVPSSNAPTNPALPQQHLAAHSYSHPSLPLGHFANMIGYPLLHQGLTYMPSAAFQQSYSANSGFHQSPVAVNNAGLKYTLPQFKSSISVNSSTPASGYGGFGSPANLPGSFTQNPSVISANSSVGYEEALRSQYKDGHHYVPLHQSENSPMWLQGAGSRAVTAVPASSYYSSFQGQNQHGVVRQSQQASHFGAPGYQNLYRSQAGVSLEQHQQQQQQLGDGNLSGSQGRPSQQSNQIWQHSY